MKLREDQAKLRTILKETITVLCKNGVQFSKGLVIDALIGITTDDASTFLLKLEETVGDCCGDNNSEADGDSSACRVSSSYSRKRPAGGATHNTQSKRCRSENDDSVCYNDDNFSDDNDCRTNGNNNDADESGNDCDETNDNDSGKGVQSKQDDGDLVLVKTEYLDHGGQFTVDEQSQADDTAFDSRNFDVGSHDGSSTLNQSSTTDDANTTGLQQV